MTKKYLRKSLAKHIKKIESGGSVKMTQNNKTIEETRANELCTGCGTCVGICPQSALEMIKDAVKGIYVPELDNEKCNQCGLCFDVCPGHSVDFKELNLEIFGKEPKNILLGNYINCYIGHAVDHEIRYNSSSGGLVTALLIFALEEGLIDGAVVTKMSDDKPLEPEVFIARTKEEIVCASKSKYCPVPANVALKEIIDAKEGVKFAVVGLPCHIQGIRKAEQINKKLREKIVLHIGIFCNHTPNFLGTEFLLDKLKIKREDLKKLDYRGEGWPGKLLIELKTGSKKTIPSSYFSTIVFGLSFFTPIRCTVCSEQTCELSDISFGDAWLPELKNDKIGTSVIIARNSIGEEVLQSAVSKKRIKLNEIGSNKVAQSQGSVIIFKKTLTARIFFYNFLCKSVPIYKSELLKPRLSAYLRAVILYLHRYISSKRDLRNLLKYVPFSVLKIYNIAIAYSLKFISKILKL